MVAEFLIKKFIINYQNIEEEKTRNAYVYLASIVGIFCNLILSLKKNKKKSKCFNHSRWI